MVEVTEFVRFRNMVARSCPKEQRAGQWAFNVLWGVRPDLAERVRGNELDPFYRDELLPAFFAFCRDHWDDGGDS